MRTLPKLHRRDETALAAPCTSRVGRPDPIADVEAAPLACKPGTSRRVLDELRADDQPVAPTALRHAFDAHTWLPASIGLRQVPLRSIADNVSVIRLLLRNHPCPTLDAPLMAAFDLLATLLDAPLGASA